MKIIFLLFAACVSLCLADTVKLKNGSVITGTLVSMNEDEIKIRTGSSVATFLRADVASVQVSGSSTPAPPPATPPPAHPVLVPRGTDLFVRMIEPIDSRSDSPGQTYRASLSEPVVVDGREVLPRNADVRVRLVDLEQSGKISGRTSLTLDLVSVTYQGRRLNADAQDVTEASGSRGKKSAIAVGGLAALGAVIGGLAGGGKGAAIGATSGAGAGGAIQVLTKGERVKVPSEAVLRFTLDRPIRN
ncbi:MAG: hypothetical protein ABI823_19325 [Bryobacteraceae bacterium]